LVLETGVLQAATMTKILFGSEYADLKFEDIIGPLGHDPRLVKISKVEMLNTLITKLASKYGLVSSTSASRALVAARGLYLNNVPIQDLHSRISVDDLLDHRIAVLRAGKDKILVLASTD